MTGMSDLSLYNEREVQDWFVFLDNLQKRKVPEMMDLVREFGLSKDRATFVLVEWVKTYSVKTPAERRAKTFYFANGGT